MKNTDLGVGIRVNACHGILHRFVKVRQGNGRFTGSNSLTMSIDLIHQPVKAFLAFVVNQAEGTAEDFTKVVEADDLEECETFVVGFLRIIVHLYRYSFHISSHHGIVQKRPVGLFSSSADHCTENLKSLSSRIFIVAWKAV